MTSKPINLSPAQAKVYEMFLAGRPAISKAERVRLLLGSLARTAFRRAAP